MSVYKLEKYLNDNYGYISSKELENIGIPRYNIQELVDKNIIRKVFRGIYIDNNLIEDEYYVLQLRFTNMIFSYNTACHLLDLSDRAPYIIDVTIPQHKKIKENLNIHYVNKDKLLIGVEEIISPYGNPIKVYNAERCICDLIKNPESVDIETYNKILRNYFKSNKKDLIRLTEYAKTFNIVDKLNTIMDVMIG